jgi:aspartyl aminopeptidase
METSEINIGHTNIGLLNFIKESPSPFHAIDNIKKELKESGFTELLEKDRWKITPGGKYFVTRNLSSLIAFRMPEKLCGGFMIAAAHSDSPTFKIKDIPELDGPENYVRINTERYGGMILDSWFDRPLSAAGRLLVRENGKISTKLVSIDHDLLMIPHVSAHMMNPNDGFKYNPACDLVPLYGLSNAKGSFMKKIAEAASVKTEDILGHDLYLVNRQPQAIWGAENEFISSPKLDDLQCVYSALRAILAANEGTSIPVLFISDNEEVGSQTKQGAGSTFLFDTLTRLNAEFGRTDLDYRCMIASSMLLSADNAHAVHPNHAELADPTHRPKLNGGVVMKYNASQLYTTDAVSAAVFREICSRANVPLQLFANRSDMRGGSTLGNISNTQVSLNSVDIGIAQLAMHSSYETAGALDTGYMIRAMAKFFETTLVSTDSTIDIK